MITVDETIYLLINKTLREMYLPESYLSIPEIDQILHFDHWIIIPSEIPGWFIVRQRIIDQD